MFEERIRALAREHRHKKIVPSSNWTEDSNEHCLVVHLPGFEEEPLCSMNTLAGKILIGGMREVNETTTEHFQEFFTLPPNSDAGKYTVKFVNEILYVTIPKVAAAVEEHKKEPEIKYENVQYNAAAAPTAKIRKWIIRTAMVMLTTAVFAFSLVMVLVYLVYLKFQSAGE